jgi:WD40 repeat protein
MPIAGVCVLSFAPLLARAADAPATVKLIFVSDIMVAHDEETGRMNNGNIAIVPESLDNISRTLSGHDSAVRRLAFFPDGSALASGSLDGNVRVWNLSAQGVSRDLCDQESWVNWIAVSSKAPSVLIAAVTLGGGSYVWDAKTDALRIRLPRPAEMQTCDFSPDGTSIAFGTPNGGLGIYDLTTDKMRTNFTSHVGDVFTARFS